MARNTGGVGHRRSWSTTEGRPACRRKFLEGCLDPHTVQSALDNAQAHLESLGNVPVADLTVMGIADLNPANVVWDGETCRLVDFEDGWASTATHPVQPSIRQFGSSISCRGDAGRSRELDSRRHTTRLRSDRGHVPSTVEAHPEQPPSSGRSGGSGRRSRRPR